MTSVFLALASPPDWAILLLHGAFPLLQAPLLAGCFEARKFRLQPLAHSRQGVRVKRVQGTLKIGSFSKNVPRQLMVGMFVPLLDSPAQTPESGSAHLRNPLRRRPVMTADRNRGGHPALVVVSREASLRPKFA